MNLNLARFYRAAFFSDIIGQDLVVKMLQNSLYTKQIFPVYLMSGKHGCGKTSLARIFAAAVNCEALDAFRLQPKSIVVPCGRCYSCSVMHKSTHPDYMEIDAASHTGVDMIRNIIESASFLPVMGNKKIYLIDEAHMLSKSAFNALLKILEEPPQTVFFILATTDMQKIPDTVRSRCFQLLLRPIESDVLALYLKKICADSQISFSHEGIEAIVSYSGGSVRDALNVIERVRYSSEIVDQKSVKAVVGFVDDALLVEMLVATYKKDTLYFEQRFFTVFSSEIAVGLVWSRLLSIIHCLIKIKLIGKQKDNNLDNIVSVANQLPLTFLYDFLQSLFTQEMFLLKTSSPLILFHAIILKHYKQRDFFDHEQKNDIIKFSHDSSNNSVETKDTDLQVSSLPTNYIENDGISSFEDQTSFAASWKVIVKQLESEGHVLIVSLLSKARVAFKSDTIIEIKFFLGQEFLKDLLESHRPTWLPVVHNFLGGAISVIVVCCDQEISHGADLKKEAEKSKVLAVEQNDGILKQESKKSKDIASAVESLVKDQDFSVDVKAILKSFPGKVIFE